VSGFFILLSVILGSFVLTGVVRTFSLKANILDIPNGRSSHASPTPVGGGVAIVVTFLLAVSYLFYLGLINAAQMVALMGGAGLWLWWVLLMIIPV